MTNNNRKTKLLLKYIYDQEMRAKEEQSQKEVIEYLSQQALKDNIHTMRIF